MMYRIKSSIKRKIRTFIDFELPLLIKNNLIISYEESLRPGYGDGTKSDNSSLGKAKVQGNFSILQFFLVVLSLE
jgi:hypothetical protein